MNTLLVTGTVAIDSVRTPFGKREQCLGGSAVYFSIAASQLHPVRLVGAVGEDFPDAYLKIFEGREIDASGLEKRIGSKTFRWTGVYQGAMNEAQTLETQLNILAEQPPEIPERFRDSRYVFLANTAPDVQLHLLEQLHRPALAVADTMNYWIENTGDALRKLIGRVDALVLNDAEARMLTGQSNLIAAARAVTQMGPRFVVVKKGEHGTLLADRDEAVFALPAYPTTEVRDPTGAGDSFAGGMMGHIASRDRLDFATLKTAVAVGTAVASLTIEDFSLDRWKTATRNDIFSRLKSLQEMLKFYEIG
jgi:cytidine kinase